EKKNVLPGKTYDPNSPFSSTKKKKKRNNRTAFNTALHLPKASVSFCWRVPAESFCDGVMAPRKRSPNETKRARAARAWAERETEAAKESCQRKERNKEMPDLFIYYNRATATAPLYVIV
ncbi:unnamed protein product, partial [Ixodes persulcatus]